MVAHGKVDGMTDKKDVNSLVKAVQEALESERPESLKKPPERPLLYKVAAAICLALVAITVSVLLR